jgi:WD40 repeat protein
MLQKRRLKRSRVVAYILGTAAMLSVILLIVAYNQSVEAERQRALADERSDEARQNLEVAKENALKAQKQEAEANLSSFRANQERENAEYNFLIAREQTQIADSARKEALRIAEIARQNELAAKEARQEALEQAEETRVAQGQTQGFRMRAVAQALATKSLQIEDDQLRGLLAYLGYQFNEENEGYDSNNDVYNGLFYAVKALDNDYFNAFRSNSTDVRSLKFVANKYLYTTGTSGRINAWEVDNMTSNRSIVIFDKPDVFVKKIFVDEKNQILVALTDGADFYTISVGARVRTIQKYTIPNTFTFDVEFLDNSTDFLISASDSSIYKFSNGQLKQFLKVRSRVYDMELFDEETLVTGNSNGQLQLWNINNSRFVKNINERSNKYIHSLSIGDNMIAAGDNSGLVTLYPIDDNLKLEDPIILRGSDGEIMTDLTFNLAENQIIASSTKGTIRLWNLNDVDEFPMIISEPGSWVNSIALLNPSYIFAGCKDQVFRLYPIKSKILASTLRSMVTRDISEEEWDRYIGNDIEYDPVFKESVFVDNSQ